MANEAGSEPEPEFEDALRKLERTVDELERGDVGLAQALAKYEEGVRLLAVCQGVLEKAERSVALLTGVDAAGEPVTVEFDASATATESPAPPAAKARKPRATPKPPPDPDDTDGLIPF